MNVTEHGCISAETIWPAPTGPIRWGNARPRRLLTWALRLVSPTLGRVPTFREAWTGLVLWPVNFRPIGILLQTVSDETLCADAEPGDLLVHCECGSTRPAIREHGYRGPR